MNIKTMNTHLSNRRTLMSFIRVFLAIVALSVVLLHLKKREFGYVCLCVAFVFLAVGVASFVHNKKYIEKWEAV